MSTKPSWLDDEDNQAAAANAAVSVAKSPIVQHVAKDPKVQSAVKESVVNAVLADSNTPSWAKDQYSPPPVPGVPVGDVENQQRSPSTASSAPAEEFQCDPELLKEMQRYHLILRVGYMVAAIIMGAAGGLILTQTPSIGQFFFGVYVMFFCLLICCFEVGLDSVAKLIAVNFGFMYTMVGRMVFLLFVGFMSFSLKLFGQLAMAILYLVFCFHIFVYVKYPRFEEYLRKKHYFTRTK